MNDIAIRERALFAQQCAMIEQRAIIISERKFLLADLVMCAATASKIATVLSTALRYVANDLNYAADGNGGLAVPTHGTTEWELHAREFAEYRAEITPALEYYGYTVADHPQRRDWAIIVPIAGEQA